MPWSGFPPERRLRWDELSRIMRILKALAFLAWAMGMAAILSLGAVETAALNQPKTPHDAYRNAAEIKGTIRYLTDRQKEIRSIATPALFGAMIFFFSVGLPYEWMEKRQLAEERNKLFDRLADWSPSNR